MSESAVMETSAQPEVITNETPVLETPMVNEAAVEIPAVIAPAATPVEAPEQTYSYQPTDAEGRTLGGKQVLNYRTMEELRDKLAEQNTLLVRKLREITRKQRLGIGEDEQIPDAAPRFDAVVEFTPRQLSDDELVKLSRDLLDPAKLKDATDTFFEAAMGAKPELLRDTLTRMQVTNLQLQAKQESDAFVAANPTYLRCKENFEVITNWMLKKNLAPVRDNFQLAYDKLKAAGLLLEAPIVREETSVTPVEETATAAQPTPPAVTDITPANAQPVQAEPSRITTEEPAQPKRPVSKIPSGLTRDHATDAGVQRTASDDIVYEVGVRDVRGQLTGQKKVYRGLAAIEAMPSEEFKRRIKGDKQFEAKYQALLDQRQPTR